MDSDNMDFSHAKFLVHCARKQAIDCIVLKWNKEQISRIVHNICADLNEEYYNVMQIVKRDVTELETLFTGSARSSNSGVIQQPSPFAQVYQQPRAPSSVQSPAPSSTHRTLSSSRSRSKSKLFESVPGCVYGIDGSGTQGCSIGFSGTPYRFVRAEFLHRFGPSHPTTACEPLRVTMDGLGQIFSSHFVTLTWQRDNHNRSHREKFWIVVTMLCVILWLLNKHLQIILVSILHSPSLPWLITVNT